MDSIAYPHEDVKPDICINDHCHEEVFRDGLCWDCFIKERTQEWDAQEDDRLAQLESLHPTLCPALDISWWGYSRKEI